MNLPDDSPLPRQRAWPALLLVTLALALALKIVADRQGLSATALVAANPPAAASLSGAAPASAAASASVAAAMAAASVEVGPPAPAASALEPQWGQPGEAAARVARAASAALATARAAAGLAPEPLADRVVELCGVGRLSLPATTGAASAAMSWGSLPPLLTTQAAAQAWPRVLASLSAPGRSERERAAGLVLQAAAAPGEEPPGSAAPGGSSIPASGAQRAGGSDAAAPAATRSLARLARRSADPTVFHWAQSMCQRESRDSPDCQRLPAREFVRKLPGDGLAWLGLAAQPAVPAAEVDRALQNAAQATQFGGHAAQLALALDRAWPEELPGYLRQHLLQQAQTLAARLSHDTFAAALDQCTADSLASTARRGRCDALARRLLAQGSDIEALAVGAVLSERLGWPEPEVEALRQDVVALAQAAALPSNPVQPYACSAVESTLEQVRAAAAEGEVQAWRRRLAIAPTTTRPAASRP